MLGGGRLQRGNQRRERARLSAHQIFEADEKQDATRRRRASPIGEHRRQFIPAFHFGCGHCSSARRQNSASSQTSQRKSHDLETDDPGRLFQRFGDLDSIYAGAALIGQTFGKFSHARLLNLYKCTLAKYAGLVNDDKRWLGGGTCCALGQSPRRLARRSDQRRSRQPSSSRKTAAAGNQRGGHPEGAASVPVHLEDQERDERSPSVLDTGMGIGMPLTRECREFPASGPAEKPNGSTRVQASNPRHAAPAGAFVSREGIVARELGRKQVSGGGDGGIRTLDAVFSRMLP